MSRSLVTPGTADHNRRRDPGGPPPGGCTFNAFPPEGYEGPILTFAAVRLGDHAHIEVRSGRWHINGPESARGITGQAGKLVLRWHEWAHLRDALDAGSVYRIAEVENPNAEQLARLTP